MFRKFILIIAGIIAMISSAPCASAAPLEDAVKEINKQLPFTEDILTFQKFAVYDNFFQLNMEMDYEISKGLTIEKELVKIKMQLLEDIMPIAPEVFRLASQRGLSFSIFIYNRQQGLHFLHIPYTADEVKRVVK